MQWFPSEVLEIDDISTCAGYAHSQGRRCCTRLSSAKTEAAEILLEQMSRYAISSNEVINRRLESLGRHLLCAQWHENQAGSLVETWKRRILRSRRALMVQEIQDLERTVEDITSRLERSSLTVPHALSSHGPSGTRSLVEDRLVQPQRYNAVHPATLSSSSRQHFTSVYAQGSVSSHLQFDNGSSPLWSRHYSSYLYKGASSSGERSTPSPLATTRQSQTNDNHNQTHSINQPDCRICLDRLESMHNVSRCHGCLEKFHPGCIKAWVERCEEMSVNATCPCW